MRSKRRAGALALAFLLISMASASWADGDDGADHTHGAHGVSRPDSHAPIGVMGDHMHAKGEVMLSYRYARMYMHGNRDGTTNLSPGEVFDKGFTVTPTEMDTQMHILGVMYAPANWVTLTAMMPIVEKSMDHIANTPMGRVKFTTRANGPGDLKLGGLLRVWENESHHFHANLGLSIPTGGTNQKDNTPASMGEDVTLPYPMQLGSGTVDFLPGLTYTGQHNLWSWGGQVMGTVRMGWNKEGYRYGDRLQTTAWGAREIVDWLSASLRMEYQNWGNVHGDNDNLPPPDFIPTADPNRQGGQRLDAGVGFNLIGTGGLVKNIRLATEVLLPVWQDLDGPQLESDWRIITGVQYAF